MVGPGGSYEGWWPCGIVDLAWRGCIVTGIGWKGRLFAGRWHRKVSLGEEGELIMLPVERAAFIHSYGVDGCVT